MLSFVPAIISTIIYWKKEKEDEFEFIKNDIIEEYDRVEQKNKEMEFSNTKNTAGYENYEHLYHVWPGQLEEIDIPELEFKAKYIETFGTFDFLRFNALFVGYIMIYVWILCIYT